jgi:hypothetical protein
MKIIKKILPLMLMLPLFAYSQENNIIQRSTPDETKTIYFTDKNNGTAIEDNGSVIYRTSDGGKNWLNHIKPAENQLREIIKTKRNDNIIRKIKKGRKPVSGGFKHEVNEGFMPFDDYSEKQNELSGIRFSLSRPGFVSIKIYNSVGKTVDELARSSFGAGFHEIKWNASKFPSDVYYYSIVSNEFSETNKIIIVK